MTIIHFAKRQVTGMAKIDHLAIRSLSSGDVEFVLNGRKLNATEVAILAASIMVHLQRACARPKGDSEEATL